MANEQERKDPAAETDISKAQSQQQPQAESGQFETDQEERQEFAQDKGGAPDEGTQGDTLAQQRTDIEGESRQTPETGETESGFVGSKGEQDSSSELVDEDEEDQRKSDGE